MRCSSSPPPSSFNSRTPGGVRRLDSSSVLVSLLVSIHAPREGCDSARQTQWRCGWCFNSRTPGGVRLLSLLRLTLTDLFQFTHPGRGATSLEILSCHRHWTFQFTHPGRGATLVYTPANLVGFTFQFTHPGRGATLLSLRQNTLSYVSIHAPREGCDSVVQSCVLWGG